MPVLTVTAAYHQANEVNELLVGLALHVEVDLGGIDQHVGRAEDVDGPVPYREGLKRVLAHTGRLRPLARPARPERVRQPG